MKDYLLRELETLDDYHRCVRFQDETWGPGFSEAVPVAILKVSQILGGVVAGAFDASGEMVGFVFGMTGPRGGRVVHWSDMLAVSPELRNSGLGYRLKLYQRELLVRAGVETMHWTFDPLESRNAHLNLNKLGAVGAEYAEDMYGQTDSPLHRGIGTDRFVVRWDMTSDHVREWLSPDVVQTTGAPSSPQVDADEVAGAPSALECESGSGDLPTPGEPRLDLEGAAVRVAIPLSIQELKDDTPELAVRWRGATRAVLSHYLSRGFEAVALLRSPTHSEYLLRQRKPGAAH